MALEMDVATRHRSMTFSLIRGVPEPGILKAFLTFVHT